MKNKNSLYLTLTILFVILSIVGGYFLSKMYQDSNLAPYTSSSVPKIELIPTDSVQEPTQYASAPTITSNPSVTPIVTTAVATTTATPKTADLTPTTKLIPTASISITPVSSKNIIPFESKEDSFSLSYGKQRQLHQDTETSGNRYTFTNKSGDFAIHVSSNDKWSWTHPGRQFTDTLLVSGKNTFRYDINTQTIIDLQSSKNNYTLQCIHNGIESLKTECEQFVSSFKIL